MSEKKKEKRTVNYKKMAVGTLIFVVVAFVLIFGALYLYLSSFNNGAVDLSKKGISSKLSKGEVEQIVKDGESCNILVMGVDVGTPGATNADDPKRTDTMIVAHYNAEDKKISLVSIPRDTLITIDGKNQKINAAHAIGGVTSAVDAVEKLLGIRIDYYGKINYEGFRKVIDAIGGVDMDITRTMNYDDPTQNLSIHFKKGTTVHLNGKKAEEFFRWRKNNDGTGFANGDLDRIENQHMFISKVMEKVKNPTIVIKIPSILSAIQSSVETNMDAKDIMKYGYIFATINKDQLSMYTVKGDLKTISGQSYLVYDDAKNKEIISKLNDNKVLDIDKSKLRIKIVNGTKKAGLASDFSTYLVSKGYNKAVTENGGTTSKTKIIVYNSNNDIKTTLIKDFKTDNIEFLSSEQENFDIIVMLGEDHEYMY
ncbi:LCP family protein [Clostridium estertheticum]|uniref:LCP family protein n=1 Tax=Clostridium estertheticum TaxID=238834 RepID=UPI0013E98ED5|nr:LCP family protein [Clostridium estertheticum]MBZ9688223.1 LCP family protein [Clostridium estertheticum]